MDEATDERPRNQERDPERLIGSSVANRYTVQRCVGQGGMGVVYLAKQDTLDRDVVLKLVRAQDGDDDAEARFLREARSMSRLSHPNVVQVFDYGRDQRTGLDFIAMEWVPGVTLSRYIKQQGPLGIEAFRVVARQMIAGVAEAHRIGMIHRDLKPSNVMLYEDADKVIVKLLDFGLSKLTDGSEALTRNNQMLGSAMYMAPELFQGVPATTRGDVYGLAVMFYQMLTARKPFRGEGVQQIVVQQLTGGFVPLAGALPPDTDIPRSVIALVERCLSPDPAQRPADGSELAFALEMAFEDPDMTASMNSGTNPSIHRQATIDTLAAPALAEVESNQLMRNIAGVGTAAVGLLAAGIAFLVVIGAGVAIAMSGDDGPSVNALGSMDEAFTFRQEGLQALQTGDFTSAATMLKIAAGKPNAPDDANELKKIAAARMKSRTPGGLLVLSEPSGLDFQIEGGPSGKTPEDLSELAPGTYQVRIGDQGAVEAVVTAGPGVAVVSSP
ncbi:MAG: serine/threonine protein kinase [Alphaproteobacteria bacterium]|nr:serine/threonine protein kinase [Alphaproteobacteria bacterium]MCB9699086.1 serine/threonine protein kinase [Alphaproteobacteria bacterium]